MFVFLIFCLRLYLFNIDRSFFLVEELVYLTFNNFLDCVFISFKKENCVFIKIFKKLEQFVKKKVRTINGEVDFNVF